MLKLNPKIIVIFHAATEIYVRQLFLHLLPPASYISWDLSAACEQKQVEKRRRSRIYSRDKLPENRKSGGVRASALTKPKRDLLQ